MRRARWALVALLAAATVCSGCDRSRLQTESPGAAAAVPGPRPEPAPEPSRSGRPAVRPSSETLARARGALSRAGAGPDENTCGPYRVFSTAPNEYLATCKALAAELDSTYQARLGVSLPHPAEGLILLFGAIEPFRDFAQGYDLPRGYAGFTLASRGIVAALTQDVPLDRFATVLGHEMAHLVHRRVFGANLAPWLSEGLADALGDTATPTGFANLSGLEGAEALGSRLWSAIESGRAQAVSAVTAKTRANFDRGTVSYDYESSALLVRFLLLDSDLGPRFRSALDRLARSRECRSECVLEALDTPSVELDARFERWLARAVETQP